MLDDAVQLMLPTQAVPRARKAPESFLVLGVDPGTDGALALIDMRGPRLLGHLDMPVRPLGTKTRFGIDGKAIFEWLASLDRPDAICIEHQSTRPTDGKASAFKLGGCFLAITSLLLLLDVPLRFATPVQWKDRCYLSKRPKDDVIGMARATFGNPAAFAHGHNKGGTKVQAIARADAAMCAYYGLPQRVLAGSR